MFSDIKGFLSLGPRVSPLISSSGLAVPSPLLTAELHEVSAEAPYSCLAKPPGPSCMICLQCGQAAAWKNPKSHSLQVQS